MIGAPLCYYGYTSAPKMAVMDKQTLKAEGQKKLRRAGDAMMAAAAGAAFADAPAGSSGDSKGTFGGFDKAKKELAKAKAKTDAKKPVAPPSVGKKDDGPPGCEGGAAWRGRGGDGGWRGRVEASQVRRGEGEEG